MKQMKLFKNRTFDKDEFEEFAIGCGIFLFAIVWFVLCICFRYVAYFTAGLFFIGLPLILLCCAVWRTFNKIFPLKDENEEND